MTGADYLKLAEAFLDEAKCDLKVVDILIKATNPGSSKYVERGLTEDEIFCVGRRAIPPPTSHRETSQGIHPSVPRAPIRKYSEDSKEV